MHEIGRQPGGQDVEGDEGCRHHELLPSCSVINASRARTSSASSPLLVEQVGDQGGRTAVEQPAGQLADHRPAHLGTADGRTVEEAPAVAAMAHDTLGFHFLEHGGDGRGGEPPIGLEIAVDLGDGGLAALPQNVHDGRLEVAELVLFGHVGIP